MYCKFFGFSEKPFDVTPDPKFLYMTSGNREVLAALIYGIRERRGFVTVVGEVGMGKTTLLNTALGLLDEKIHVAFIFQTNVTFDELLATALVSLGLAQPSETLPKVEAVRRLNSFAIGQLARGGNVALVVDEAHNLDRFAMENLRLLSNLETRTHKLIQIVLSGQPELDVKLSQPELRQLTQRISLKRYLTPLSERETYEYIQHRLRTADYTGPALFSRQSKEMIWEYSGGVPRKINALCDNAFLIAYALRKKTIEVTVVEEVIKDLSWSPFASSKETQKETPKQIPVRPTPRSRARTSPSRFDTATSLVVGTCLIFLTGLFLGLSVLNLQRSAQRVAASTLPEQKRQSGHGPVREAPHGPFPSRDGPAGIGRDTDGRGTGQTRVVVVKGGENLFEIIVQAYGRYDKSMLSAVLQENPEIQNQDRMRAGQVIRLPHIQ